MREQSEVDIAKLANEIRDKIIGRMHKRHQEHTSNHQFRGGISIFRGPYTFVMLDNKFSGIAKFNPNDHHYKAETGLRIAVHRAVKHQLGLEE